MKIHQRIKIISFLVISLAAAPISCSDILESEYRSDLGPEFFSTPDGLQAGVHASYAITRYFWGSEGFTTSSVTGTDEVTRGGDGGPEFHEYTILPNNGTLSSIWNNSYTAINNLNGVLQYGPDAALPQDRKTELLAEAKFLRAYFYFLLVQNFGDVPLNLTFNTVPNTKAYRTNVKEVYEAIVQDLKDAANALPNKPTSSPSKARASKPAALHLLAKVLLTKGWNVNAREGDGKSDFESAYTVADTLIANSAQYDIGLEPNYADVYRNTNEYGREVLFVLDRNTDPVFSESGYNNTTAEDGNKENRLNHYWVSFYTLADQNVNFGITGAPEVKVKLVSRSTLYGRPYRRFRPNPYTYEAFTKRDVDSRYDNTFQKVWLFNRPTEVPAGEDAVGTAAPTITTTRGVLQRGDTAIFMPGHEVTEADRKKVKGLIMAPSQYSYEWFPTMIKHLDPTRQHYNDPSDRPIILMRLGETYLIAAEAAFKAGNLTNAKDKINALRERAAFRTTNSSAENAADAIATRISESDVDIKFILEERTRELYGEMHRWYDLVRTQTLITRVKQYNPLAGPKIQDYHVLRPIPSTSQMDLVTNRDEFPQNPGY
ncbi:RagB/SusD family nutrient uptake outer membrane protein [Pseudochryseolinea flava]|uniref:RagB/SusD family nutrient uptake outer membrane protein n=1 Tax=Pseudochryseolinea flava TaxID=2059302 RepID=A0A364XXP9_9BACT|nr:RagB/SusD family nutrient uptake outer membrane protein [Pseudochryseolinea flava]RAV99033.1 RagB/SusD family nutrient uptake outer membrane protein [Pseudochryseolinea flava]